MPSSDSVVPLESFQTFGDLLKYLRRRARMTQRELCIAVGYSEAQISRLEQNLRPPDLASLTALFIPALYLEDEPLIVTRLMELAAQARGEALPQSGMITFSRSVRRETRESVRTVEEELSNNLPLQLTSFVGREDEIVEITNLLVSNSKSDGQVRLITLLGSGGCGKTRLALEAAKQLTETYRDGIWLVELAPISNPAYVPQTFITTLGMPETRDGSFLNTIKKFLRAKHMLLIVDNCEHVLSETANTVYEILLVCPQVHIIATSREILDIPGEVRFSVPSLQDSESISLFTDRARTALSSFELTEKNASRVAQICSRLDGIPLAIELAASRLSTMSVDQVASLLDDRLNLLTTGSRFTLPRQQTLRAAIDWSYNLLSHEDKKLFYSLSVFAGGFDLDAASSVIADSASVLDAITRFVDKSLVVVDRLRNGETRYRLLEMVREYCREKLQEAGEEWAIRERHLTYFLAFAKEANLKMRGKDHLESMRKLEREHDNLRAALAFTMYNQSPASAHSGLRLAFSLDYFWFLSGYHDEGRNWIRQLMQLPHQPRLTHEYARALNTSAHWQTDAKEAYRLFDEGLSLSYTLEDEQAIAAAHFSRASYGWLEDDPSAGRFHFEKSMEAYRKAGDRWNLARALADFGEFAQVRLNDRIAAWNFFEESLRLARELEDARGIAFALIRLGDLAIEQNKLEEASHYCSEGLIVASELNDQESMAWGLNDLGVVAMCKGKLEEARRLCVESLTLSQEWGGAWHTIIRRYWLARVVAYEGKDARAIELLEENITESQTFDFDWGRAASLQGLGDAALRRGDLENARSFHAEAITMLHTGNYLYSLAYSLDSFAALAQASKQPKHALTLLAAADALRDSIHTALLPPESKEREQLITTIKEKTDHDLIVSLTAQGHAMKMEQAIEYALTLPHN